MKLSFRNVIAVALTLLLALVGVVFLTGHGYDYAVGAGLLSLVVVIMCRGWVTAHRDSKVLFPAHLTLFLSGVASCAMGIWSADATLLLAVMGFMGAAFVLHGARG